MKLKSAAAFLLGVLVTVGGLRSAHGLEPQTLFNFLPGPGTVTASLVQGPDGNFYGTTPHVGAAGTGTVFRVTPAGTLTVLAANLPTPTGLTVGNDGFLYGMTSDGGTFGFGSVFKLSTNGVLTTIAEFDLENGRNPKSGLVLAADGNFYGTTPSGGSNFSGNVFRVTPAGVVTSLFTFDDAENGGLPWAGLTVGADGNLYGLTQGGGVDGGDEVGTIFKITTGGALTTLYSFKFADGFTRQSRLALGADGNLYGTSRDGGANDMGTVFRITPNGVFTNLVSFAGGTNGAVPYAELTLGADGQLYGTTQLGGGTTDGTAFKVSTNGVLTTLVSFGSPAGGTPQAGLLRASDGNFYGASLGTIFRMTPGGAVSVLASLFPLDGVNPQSGLTLGADGNFYGTTRNGGSNGVGTIFRLSPGGGLTTLFAFDGNNGASPQAALAVGVDGNFYGTTAFGGAGNFGTIFRFSTNGAFASLASFNGTNGGNPQCQLVADAAGNFYGTAPEQGPNFDGTVFRVTTNGVLTTLAAFNDANGSAPEDGLTLGKDGNFYGTTANGGSNGVGTVFRITPGGVLTSLFSFNTTNGAIPLGGLVQGQGSDANLYGTTGFGGTNGSGAGTIFRVATNGALTTLHHFNFADGEEPVAKMIFGSDGNLYGTARDGGSVGGNPSGNGLVFRATTNGVLTPLALFRGTNGASPMAPLTLGSDGNLYGVTETGGTGGAGTVFRINLNPAPQFTGIASLPAGGKLLSGNGPAASPFRLWAATNPARPFASWTLLTNGVFAADGTFSFTDTAAAAIPARFYRVSVP